MKGWVSSLRGTRTQMAVIEKSEIREHYDPMTPENETSKLR